MANQVVTFSSHSWTDEIAMARAAGADETYIGLTPGEEAIARLLGPRKPPRYEFGDRIFVEGTPYQ